jgi:hypothetical protein
MHWRQDGHTLDGRLTRTPQPHHVASRRSNSFPQCQHLTRCEIGPFEASSKDCSFNLIASSTAFLRRLFCRTLSIFQYSIVSDKKQSFDMIFFGFFRIFSLSPTIKSHRESVPHDFALFLATTLPARLTALCIRHETEEARVAIPVLFVCPE